MTNIPYYIIHAIVAVSLQLTAWISTGNLLAGTATGISFYVGREIRDREKLGYWDYPGLIAPLIACIAVHFVLA
jgi:hypothetical protein